MGSSVAARVAAGPGVGEAGPSAGLAAVDGDQDPQWGTAPVVKRGVQKLMGGALIQPPWMADEVIPPQAVLARGTSGSVLMDLYCCLARLIGWALDHEFQCDFWCLDSVHLPMKPSKPVLLCPICTTPGLSSRPMWGLLMTSAESTQFSYQLGTD
ncbi:MORN repeat-containing protein 4 isoform X1 [Mauremys reevesii]|uniref:MORN repeat-containing protein 4 isoform X1 n=1 Tax=Mauremys reevesii TaxID=260615 RepID=UPI00193EC375|nr:MORN repeat-containing protein 4 isoform X1 [Mauremys reevesii]